MRVKICVTSPCDILFIYFIFCIINGILGILNLAFINHTKSGWKYILLIIMILVFIKDNILKENYEFRIIYKNTNVFNRI